MGGNGGLGEPGTRPDYVQPGRKPPWLRVKLPAGPAYGTLRQTIDTHRLHTVCESAKCPNMGECWARGTATVMILGNVCTPLLRILQHRHRKATGAGSR